MWQKEISILGDDTVLIECGPMRMFIEASERGFVRPDLCVQAAEASVRFLEEVADSRRLMFGPVWELNEPPMSSLAHVMWEAAGLVGDRDLTPMGAVAGTIADATADFLWKKGMTRVVVNNGGDVAVRVAEEEKVIVGIRPDVSRPQLSHRLAVTGATAIRGIATSGLGGRSFTRGIASAASVFARNAAVADAAASAVANATYFPAPAILRCRADLIDPDTDLNGVDITTQVGPLSETEVDRALRQGLTRAEELCARGLIVGACIFVKGRLASTASLVDLLEPVHKGPIMK